MYCHHFFVATLFLGLVNFCTSYATFNKPCPNPKVIENFDKHKFSGTWYHIERYMDDDQAIVLKFMTCSTVSYTIKDEETVAINNIFKTYESSDRGQGQGYTTKLVAQAKIRDQKEQAKWIVFLQHGNDTSAHRSLVDLNLNYWMLATDYDNYALVWTCQSDGTRSLLDAMILSRKPTLDENVLADLHKNLQNYQLDQALFHAVKQKSCQY